MNHERQPPHQLHELERHRLVLRTPRLLLLHLNQKQLLRLLRREQTQLHHLRVIEPIVSRNRPLRRRVNQTGVPRVRDELGQPRRVKMHPIKNHQPLRLRIQPLPHNLDDLIRVPQLLRVSFTHPPPRNLVPRDAQEPVLQLVPRLGPYPVHAAGVVIFVLEDVLSRKVGLAAAGEALDQHGRRALGPALAVHEHLVEASQLVFAADEKGVGSEGLGVDEQCLVFFSRGFLVSGGQEHRRGVLRVR